MQVTIVGKENSPTCLGVSFRRNRPGPEQQLVARFLDTLQIKTQKGCEVTVFREPRVAAAYPDLVIVVWHVATAQKWNSYRADLTTSDIRIMHFLGDAGAVSVGQLEDVFRAKVGNSLIRLQAANMISQDGTNWRARPLSECFAARHIIAMEAKISEWQEALEQAYINTWFASASYVVVPKLSPKSKLVERAKALGVGVQEVNTLHFDPRQLSPGQLPVSYASWLFNEWVWRVSQHSSMEQRGINGCQLAQATVF